MLKLQKLKYKIYSHSIILTTKKCQTLHMVFKSVNLKAFHDFLNSIFTKDLDSFTQTKLEINFDAGATLKS